MSLFISHGSPMMVIEESAARRFLRQWSDKLQRPEAILVASAHWESRHGALVSISGKPETIHDFGGFPSELYDIRYDAKGTPDMAHLAIDLLEAEGFDVHAAPNRGLDHGAWAPLSLMYPDAEIPVFQISMIRGATPEHHYRMGLALKSLAHRGLLVVGSGSMTHNLREYMGHRLHDPAPGWVTEFEDWMKDALESNRIEDLFNYRAIAPHAVRNHPSEEHLLPLFFALGAAGENAKAVRVHSSHVYGVISMDMYTLSGQGKGNG